LSHFLPTIFSLIFFFYLFTAIPEVYDVYMIAETMETNITVEEYDTITLQCNVSNSIPKADLTWVELIKPYVPTTVYPSTTPSLNATTTTSIANSTVNATTTPMNTTVTMTTAATTTVAGQMTANWLNTSIPANIIKVRSLYYACVFIS